MTLTLILTIPLVALLIVIVGMSLVAVLRRRHREEYPELSAASKAMLEAGIRSAQEKPSVYLGSFAQYTDDDRNDCRGSER